MLKVEELLAQLRLDQLLIERGLATSRARAEDLISRGSVLVDGQVVNKPGKKFRGDVSIELTEQELPWVSRSALKLIAALDHWNIHPKNRTCVDVGASTGGFTQVLLDRGAKFVHAVDTGKAQLAPQLAHDSRVNNWESTNFRDMPEGTFIPQPEFGVMDVSFTSQTLLYPALKRIIQPGAGVVALIKPQFEAGREHLGRSGVIRDTRIHDQVLDHIRQSVAEHDFELIGIIPSPIEGGDGNREFLIHFKIRKT